MLDSRVNAKTDGPRRVFVSVSTDYGESFSAPTEVPTPEGIAAYPDIVANADRAFLAWQQDESAYVMELALQPTEPVAGL